MQKPTGKQIAILNVVNNTPMALIMSTAAPLLAGMPLVFGGWLANVVIAFFLACIVNLIVPVALISDRFPRLFKLDPQSLLGHTVATLLVSAIFVLIIGLILNIYNVPHFPAFIFAFLDTYIPLWLICAAIAFFTTPVANKLAFGGK